MSRPNLKRPNSDILPVKIDSFVPNIMSMRNSRSMTQIDSLKDVKIDSMKPIKKWTYLDNSDKNFPCLPDCEMNINMDEFLSDKVNFHKHEHKSSSVVKGSINPPVFRGIEIKEKSANSLSNKFEENTNSKTDYLLANARPIRNSRSMTQIDCLNDKSKSDKMQPIKNWTYLDNFSKTSLFSPDPATNINMDESLSDKTNFYQDKSKSVSVIRENIRPSIVESLESRQNSLGMRNKNENDTETELKFQAFSANRKLGEIEDQSQTKTDTSTQMLKQNFASENKDKSLEVSFIHDINYNSRKPNLKNSETITFSPENSKETKFEVVGNNENKSEDESIFDSMWQSYVERPLLPLKPFQKKKSLSCTNLVQTIKGFSKKKTGAHNRFSSPENTLFESKELCSSEANISDVPPRKISTDLADENFRRHDESNTSVTTKAEWQSLQHYSWYHLIDAKEANKRLLHMHRNGTFLIRPASHPTNEVLHTLCVVCLGRVYNFHIKKLKNGRITLSKKKEEKETFSSLLDMIKYHQTVPIIISLAGQVIHVHLLITPPK